MKAHDMLSAELLLLYIKTCFNILITQLHAPQKTAILLFILFHGLKKITIEQC